MKPDQNKPYGVHEHACYLISRSHVNTYGMSVSEVMDVLRKVDYTIPEKALSSIYRRSSIRRTRSECFMKA